MRDAFRDICAGHQHAQVLLAVGYLLVDALDEEFFEKKQTTVDERIDDLMAAMKRIVVRLSGRQPQ